MDSNLRPELYKNPALPSELRQQKLACGRYGQGGRDRTDNLRTPDAAGYHFPHALRWARSIGGNMAVCVHGRFLDQWASIGKHQTVCSTGWDRTTDSSLNKRALYQLSYRGIANIAYFTHHPFHTCRSPGHESPTRSRNAGCASWS